MRFLRFMIVVMFAIGLGAMVRHVRSDYRLETHDDVRNTELIATSVLALVVIGGFVRILDEED